MALRNTLLVCAAIVSGGAVAGVATQPRPYLAPSDGASSSYGATAQPESTPSTPDQMQPQTYGQASSYGPPPQSDDQQTSYGRQQPSGPQTYGQQAPQGYGQQPQQAYGQPQGYGQNGSSYGQAPSYGPPQSYDQQRQYGPSQQYGQANAGQQNGSVSLTQVEHADRVLPRMPVESTSGQRLGEVAQVLMQDGRPREVVLDQGTRIPASDLTFVPARSVLVAQASQPSSGYGAPGYGPPQQPGGQQQPYPRY